MKKHIPVLFNEVIKELKSLNLQEEITAIDCTLGQAGHSNEIFETINSGVLLSIDLNKKTIEWVADHFELEKLEAEEIPYQKDKGNKKWIIANSSFSNLREILQKIGKVKIDFLLADLGFSNFELGQNLGISFKEANQELNMNYSGTGLKAKDILNNFDDSGLTEVFRDYFDQNELNQVLNKIKTVRGRKSFEKTFELSNAFKSLPQSFLIRVVQALRSYVNHEEDALRKLCEDAKSLLSDSGKALIITFNPLEEKIVKEIFVEYTVLEPNINEIITNPQSRSAKLYIYKKTTGDKDPIKEKRT